LAKGRIPAARASTFAQGSPSTTGNPLDAAIFRQRILHPQGRVRYNTYYTPVAGQFDVNASGYLIDKTTAARVQAISGKSDLSGHPILPVCRRARQRPPLDVSFVGNLSRGATSDQITAVKVYDSVGAATRCP